MQTTHTIICRQCESHFDVTAPSHAWADWEGGVMIQKAFYMLPADERELILSGTCGSCFDAMFPDEDE